MSALVGLKVLDCTHVIAGAYCSLLLADLGADVVKIEPPGGETTRGHPGQAFRAFDFVNRNKRAIALDLTTASGAAAVRRLAQTADVFVAPSTGQESFGIVLLEAMAAGRAVVASDIHGYKRVVQRNVSGLLVEPKDPDALAEALERLIVAPELRQSLGDAGARRAPEYDWQHVTKQLVAVYEEVIAKGKGMVEPTAVPVRTR